jgi:hypothetical protein
VEFTCRPCKAENNEKTMTRREALEAIESLPNWFQDYYNSEPYCQQTITDIAINATNREEMLLGLIQVVMLSRNHWKSEAEYIQRHLTEGTKPPTYDEHEIPFYRP